MQKYIDLIMGLICGIVLTLLNNNLVHESLGSIFTLFDPNNLNTISIWKCKINNMLFKERFKWSFYLSKKLIF